MTKIYIYIHGELAELITFRQKIISFIYSGYLIKIACNIR
jgi:hypothetical protein